MPDRHDLDDWFGRLKNNKGQLCCSSVEGVAIATDQVDIRDGHYWVFLEGKWYPVPDEAVVQEGNRYGSAVVWPQYYWALDGVNHEISKIRCFMPGSGT